MINFKEKISSDNILQQALTVLYDYDVFLVGGYLRDLFFNKISHDKDLIVTGIAPEIAARKIAEKTAGHFVELDSENKIYRVVFDDKKNYIDIVTPQTTLEEDLRRRDFTINALCYDIKNQKLIDIFNGISHLKQKKLVGICEQNFFDDPLRILRAFRFQSVLEFELDEKLAEITKKHSDLIFECATERINTELIKIFGGKNAYQTLSQMDEIGIVEKFFPIIKEVKKIPSNSHHHLPLFWHSMSTMKEVENLFQQSMPAVAEHLRENFCGEHSRISFLKLSAFLHDIGKPQTWTIEEGSGRHRFIKHDEVGAEIVKPILKNLKFSNKQITYVKKMIRNHIYPSALVGAQDVTDNAKRRFLRKLEDDTIDIIILAQADRLSARGEKITDDIVEKNVKELNNLMQFYFEQKEKLKPLPKLIDGNEIMEILQLQPSPKLHEIINAIHEEQLNEKILTKENAIDFLKKNFG